jgi:hypothetical protein
MCFEAWLPLVAEIARLTLVRTGSCQRGKSSATSCCVGTRPIPITIFERNGMLAYSLDPRCGVGLLVNCSGIPLLPEQTSSAEMVQEVFCSLLKD